MKLYGSLNNRFEENKQYCDKIEVGTGMTEYSWSDRHAYEVVEVKDQKHVKVREYDHVMDGEPMTNSWKLVSNEENPVKTLVKRGNYWYYTTTVTADDVKKYDDEAETESDRLNFIIWLCQLGVNKEEVLAKGKVTKYHRTNVSFGIADYYYDYEF